MTAHDKFHLEGALLNIQREIASWSNLNFPDNKPYHPLLGIGEEVGELMHAHLKLEQNIRGDALQHYEDKKDAVGDILIYLMDYCQRNNIEMGTELITTWDKVSKRNWRNNKTDGTTTSSENE